MAIAYGTYTITANGKVGQLILEQGNGITGLAPEYPIAGSAFGVDIVGFFDDAAQTLVFFENKNISAESGALTPFTLYRGAFVTLPGPNAVMLAGEFEVFPHIGQVARSGWFAQMQII